jgi:CubicO group peptidase (beta-lactamase class C family)
MKQFIPGILLLLFLVTGCQEKSKQEVSSPYAAAIEESRRMMDSLLYAGRSPGMDIAVSMHGEVVWSEGFGYADLEHQVEVIPGKTRFRIGSVSKPLSAAAVGRLMDKNQIDLDLPIQTYVPYFPEKNYPVTLRQIGGHLAGIRHYRNREFMMAKHFNTVEEGISVFKDDSLLFEPGTRFAYSSYGFNLLSAAVEGASGEKFLDYMQREVFDPLGMISTTADMNDSVILHRASFYEVNDAMQFENAPYVDNSYKWAGGGFLSTTLDLLKFGEAHMAPGYLSAATLAVLTSPQVLVNGDTTDYGLGWFSWDENGRKFFSHGGGSIGGITDFVVYPEGEFAIAVLSNSSNMRYGDVVERIVELFLAAGEE